MTDTFEERLERDLSEVVESRSKEGAKRVRGKVIDEIENAEQGAHGLKKYVSEVKRARDEQGRYKSGYTFEIDHPTARLHEFGGPIEPTYSKAMVEGWDRDGFYDALQDCEDYVFKKRLLRSAQMQVEVDER